LDWLLCRFQFWRWLGNLQQATTTTTPLFDGLGQFFPGTTPSGSTAGANSGVASLNQSGPIGGFQFGYNWQFSPLIVFGLEADIQGAAISGRGENTGTSTESFAGTSTFFKSVTTANSAEALMASFTNAAITASGDDLVTSEVNWLGTVRGRLGYLVTPNLLLYATGGLAYGGVSASDSLTTNFNNLSADSFALAYAQASGTAPTVTVSPTTAGPNPVANASATAGIGGPAGALSVANAAINPTSSASAVTLGNFSSLTATQTSSNPPSAVAIATSSSVAGSTTSSTVSFAQTLKPLSAALTTTSQSFARVSDTRVGASIGGGLEWMMAPNWSVKVEGLYYDLGTVTVTPAPLTSSINPITVAASQGASLIPNGAANSAVGAISKFVGPATISNAASTRVSFQGVIIRVGLSYHFN
jgi:opacity protein-like surface antigen